MLDFLVPLYLARMVCKCSRSLGSGTKLLLLFSLETSAVVAVQYSKGSEVSTQGFNPYSYLSNCIRRRNSGSSSSSSGAL